ncbi:hypothetical protein SNEBB_008872, partial [Seison nebaliae]
MGDSCCNPLSMGRIIELIREHISNNTYIKSIEIGKSQSSDILHSFVGDVNEQIDDVCKMIKNDENLKGKELNAIGFSQGAQFLRGLLQRCRSDDNLFQMNNLISIGGQHQGVFGLPRCTTKFFHLCKWIAEKISTDAYDRYSQHNIIQAQYWHDSLNEKEYRSKNMFLSDINQEQSINPIYKSNILSLNQFVLVKFLKDTMVIPKETEWFGFYANNSTDIITPLVDSELYKEDRLGLQDLNKKNR